MDKNKYKQLISSPDKANILLAHSMFVLSRSIELDQFCWDVVHASYNRKYIDYTASKNLTNLGDWYFWCNVIDDWYIGCVPAFSIRIDEVLFHIKIGFLELHLDLQQDNDIIYEVILSRSFLEAYNEFSLMMNDSYRRDTLISIMRSEISKALHEFCKTYPIEVFKAIEKSIRNDQQIQK